MYTATAGASSMDSSIDNVKGMNVVPALLFRKSFDQANGSSVGTISPRRAAATTAASDTSSRSCASASSGWAPSAAPAPTSPATARHAADTQRMVTCVTSR